MGQGWVVHKFGGTSVAGADRYRAVAEILARQGPAWQGIVVSAMSGVTDALIDLVEGARSRDETYVAKLEALETRHLDEASKLLAAGPALDAIRKTIESDFHDLQEILRGIWLVRAASERTVELVSGYGELWSAQLLHAHLREKGVAAAWLDARQVLVVEHGETGVSVDWKASEPKLRDWLKSAGVPAPNAWLVITGFVAATADGIPTTLRRNGSDYSASIFGALLGASSITIWKEVDGVMSADPRFVPEAKVLDELSYDEATELAYFGAKVVHPSTMAPAIERKIPVLIRNAFNPAAPGTRIHADARSRGLVKGFSTVDGVALVNVEGTGMMGVPGVAHRLFGALREVGVSVVMISQASSEHSICFAIPEKQSGAARAAIEKAFFAELHHGQIERIDVAPGCSILAAVGDGMVERPGVAAQFFGALGLAGVNIRAIAQGSSERNISAVVGSAEAKRALRAVHSAFFLSPYTLSIGVIGPGLIGKTLLRQLEEHAERLRRESNLDLRVRAIADSKRMALGGKQLDLKEWEPALREKGVPADLAAFAQHVRADHIPHAVIIDCTSSPEIPRLYGEWFAQGIHVITPNKKGNSGPLESYRRLRSDARARRRHYLYETTVGAGLPVINTLRDLVQTGDRVRKVEGILSGTLSYIFNTYDGMTPFSAIVADARAKGYTEPDPRDDLSGMDVARKLVILAREMGLSLELSDIAVKSLVPAGLEQGSADEFLKALPAHDEAMLGRLREAEGRGEVLRYVGVVEDGGGRVELLALPKTHPFARVQGSDNIVAFTTERYSARPLVVQGPGAGPEVTAAGVFADLLRLASYVGAPV